MKRGKIKNVAASVRQHLLNEARASGRPFNELLQYFAMERFLYRLSESPHRERFVLKGALMLAAWVGSRSRSTKDIDLLGYVANEVESIVEVVREICRQEIQPDGLAFDPASVTGERIAAQAEYEGVRVRFQGHLGTARLSMQVDVGFGDAVVPEPVTTDYPTILELPAPRIRGYTRESVIAEKFHTMARLGLLNSRMRDFFDVWTLSRQFGFEGHVLAAAVRQTFARRGLEIPSRPVALTMEFAQEITKVRQWKAFVRKSRLQDATGELGAVVEAIAGFLGPLAEALHEERGFGRRWSPPGPWSDP